MKIKNLLAFFEMAKKHPKIGNILVWVSRRLKGARGAKAIRVWRVLKRSTKFGSSKKNGAGAAGTDGLMSKIGNKWVTPAMVLLGVGVGAGAGYLGGRYSQPEVAGPMDLPGDEHSCDREFEGLFAESWKVIKTTMGAEGTYHLARMIRLLQLAPNGALLIDRCDGVYLTADAQKWDIDATQAWLHLCSHDEDSPLSRSEYLEMLQSALSLDQVDHIVTPEIGDDDGAPHTGAVISPHTPGFNLNSNQSTDNDDDLDFDDDFGDGVNAAEISLNPTVGGAKLPIITFPDFDKAVKQEAAMRNKIYNRAIAERHYDEVLKVTEPGSYKVSDDDIEVGLTKRGLFGLFAIEGAKAVKSFQDIRLQPAEAVSTSTSNFGPKGHVLTGFKGANDTVAFIDSIYKKGAGAEPWDNRKRAVFLAALMIDNNIDSKVDGAEFPRRGLSTKLTGTTLLLRNLKGSKFVQKDYENLKTTTTAKERESFYAFWKSNWKSIFKEIAPRDATRMFTIDRNAAVASTTMSPSLPLPPPDAPLAQEEVGDGA